MYGCVKPYYLQLPVCGSNLFSFEPQGKIISYWYRTPSALKTLLCLCVRPQLPRNEHTRTQGSIHGRLRAGRIPAEPGTDGRRLRGVLQRYGQRPCSNQRHDQRCLDPRGTCAAPQCFECLREVCHEPCGLPNFDVRMCWLRDLLATDESRTTTYRVPRIAMRERNV